MKDQGAKRKKLNNEMKVPKDPGPPSMNKNPVKLSGLAPETP